jgi:predicted nucleic acid-binding protein
MKRLLFDVNVILDILLDRAPHVRSSAAVFAAVEAGSVEGCLSAHAVTTIHYLIRREKSAADTRRIISAVLRALRVAAVDHDTIQEALQLPCPDFEDAVTAAAAHSALCDWVVTRDTSGFRGSPVPTFTPEALLPLLRKN